MKKAWKVFTSSSKDPKSSTTPNTAKPQTLSTNMTQPIKVFAHASGPNAWKVTIILDELEVPYELEFVDFPEMHKPAFEKYNPNGRVPAIVDPNTNVTLWESGAIIKYLVETYDKSGKLGISTTPEKFYLDQYLFFQASGQGPYFGQALWFTFFHQEKLPSAKERYMKEIKRITKVLDNVLADKEFLVGNKVTYADLSFVPWYWAVEGMEPAAPGFKGELEAENPNWKKWIEALGARPSVLKAVAARKDKMTPPKK